MAHIPYHPAIGFGDLLPGSYAVPQNPIRDAGTPLVPSTVALTGGRAYKVPTLGELLPGKFTVPQNPIVNTLVNGYSGMAQAWTHAKAAPCSAAAPSSSNMLLIGAAVIGGFWLLSKG
jgi:hypothetical protein